MTGASCVTIGGATVGSVGVYKSVDKGENWAAIASMPTTQGVKSLGSLNIYNIVMDPSDPNALYACTRGQGLYYTYNGGESWQEVAAMKSKYIYGLAIDPKDKCVIYASDGQHLFKTNDCSRSWKLIFTEERTEQRFVSVSVDFGDSKIVYAAQLGGDILRSIDGGQSWRVVKRFNFNLQYLGSDSFVPKRLYAAGYRDGLYRSDDGGENWIDLNNGLESFTDSKTFYRFVLNPGQKDSIFWISKYGILRSDDAGASWSDMSLLTPPGSVNIYSFAISPHNQKELYYTGTLLDSNNQHVRSTFYKSIDGGKNWITKKLPTNTIPVSMIIHPEKNDVLIMGFTVLEKPKATGF